MEPDDIILKITAMVDDRLSKFTYNIEKKFDDLSEKLEESGKEKQLIREDLIRLKKDVETLNSWKIETDPKIERNALVTWGVSVGVPAIIGIILVAWQVLGGKL